MSEKIKNCSHQIYRSKYERNSPEITNWWYRLFDELEKDAAIPPHQRPEILKNIFPQQLLYRIIEILELVRSCKLKKPTTPEKKSEEQLSESLLATLSNDKQTQRQEIGKNNPYKKFIERGLYRAATWHTLPPLSFEEMNLGQKAEAITTTIAVDFVKWMETVSDEDSPTSLTVPLVLKMFEIGFNTHAARSLQVRVKEMASVPDGVAILKGMPTMAKRSQLHKQLLRDLRASKKKKRVFAFGSKLDRDYQILPPKIADIDKWLVCKRVPEHLESMATVWQGITHLRSTRAFCKYLSKHPEIKPPKFLIDNKMLEENSKN